MGFRTDLILNTNGNDAVVRTAPMCFISNHLLNLGINFENSNAKNDI